MTLVKTKPITNLALGKFIRARRKLTTLSQHDLAAEVNSTQQHISDIETGKVTPSIDLYVDIVIALNLKTADFFRELDREVLPELIRLKKLSKERE